MPLTANDVKAAAAQVVSDALADELLRTGKVRVMERAQMETILKEQGLSQSGACDGSECAVEVGKLLSIDRMVVGSLGQIGSSYSLSVRAVNVSTGEILGSARRQQKGEIDEVTTGIVPAVAQEIAKILSGAAATSSLVSDTMPKAKADSTPKVAETPELASAPVSPPVVPAPLPAVPVAPPDAVPQASVSGGLSWGWWVAGGAVVAGGAAAAVLLTGGSSSSSQSSSPDSPSSTNQTLHVVMP